MNTRRKPVIIGHRQISPTWHQLTTADGTFFGYSEEQVREKAEAYRRRTLIAHAERHNHLQLMERQRGVRLV
jgi:hypothetical protein